MSDGEHPDLPFILRQVVPGGECECREDIPTESIHIEWGSPFLQKSAWIEKCENCAGCREVSEVETNVIRP